MDEACPECSEKITKHQKFCTRCRWKIDPNIFASKIVCTGRTDEGKTCGKELNPDMNYCPECGTNTKERKSLQGEDSEVDTEVITNQTNNKNTNVKTPTKHQEAENTEDVKHNPYMSYTSVRSKKSNQAVLMSKQASGPSYDHATSTSNDSAIENTHKQCVKVTFHCIVDPSMLKRLEENTLNVVFENSFLGEQEAKIYELKEIRKLDNNYIEYEGDVSMPKHLAFYPQKYNYLMMQGEEEVWEYVYNRNNRYQTNRTLHITESNVKKGEYHSFDGVIREPPNKSTWDQFKGFMGFDTYKELLKQDADIAFLAFLPRWKIFSIDAEGVNGEDLINCIKFVVDGLKEIYVNLTGLWNTSEFRKVIGSMLKPKILTILPDLQTKEKLNIERKILQLVTAITVAYLVMKYDIDIESRERNLLCESLLPHLDFQRARLYDMNALLSFFPQTEKLVSEGVLNFSKMIASKTSNPKWTYCLPIIHFLYEKCVPYVNDDVKVNHAEAEWWGIAELKSDIELFKSKTMSWNSSTCEVLKVVCPYFQMDYLLPRSFMRALKQEQILEVISSGYIPSDVILAVIFYYTKTTCSYEILKKWFDEVRKQNRTVTGKKIPLFDARRSYLIAADVLEYNLKQKTTNILVALEMFLESIHTYDEIQHVSNFQCQEFRELGITKDAHLTLLKRITLDFCECLTGDHYRDELECLKRWNDALKVEIPNGRIRDIYLKSVEDKLKAGIEKVGSHNKLMEIYLLENETFHDTVNGVLSEVAMKAINNCSNVNLKIIRSDKAVERLSHLINTVLKQHWDKDEARGPQQILNHILRWAPLPTFIQMYHKVPQNLKFLNEPVEILKNVVSKLVDGEIIIHELKTILENRDSFKKNIQAFKGMDRKTDYLNLREKEWQTYKETEKRVHEFTEFCTHCKGDTNQLHTKLKILEGVDSFPLSQLVKTQTKVVDLQHYQPFVTVFELTCDQLKYLPDIIECRKSHLFSKLWEEIGNEVSKQKNRLLTTQEVFSEVWKSTLSQWKSLVEKMRKGDLLFTDFEKYFGNTESSILRSELLLLVKEGKNEWVKERLDQVDEYRNIRSSVFGAAVILDVVNAYELKGDFSQVVTISDSIILGDAKMNKLNKSLLKTCSILRDVTNERAECLTIFIKCKPLVDWLRKSMRYGLQELKVFVDLASISAGEGAMEIDKVNCLHSSTTGYAPLIFNLQQNCNTKEFLEKCQEVWKVLDSDPHLPKKLIDTNRHLAWLQTVKKTHGSVEVSSLQQVVTINKKGIYQIGNLTKSTNVRKPTLTEVLELHVAGENGNDKILYKCEQLFDLHSRLMLVAGKADQGKDEVDRFTMILDSAVRLGKIYIKLVEEGCVLFSQLHVKLICDQEQLDCASINFAQEEDIHTLKGRIDKQQQDVSTIILTIAKYLEDFHAKWLSYISEKREKYYLLNFFTINQIVMLQQELVKLGSSQEPSVLIFPILSAVKKGCTKSDLAQAMAAAKLDVEDLKKKRGTEKEIGKVWCSDSTHDFEPIEVDQSVEDLTIGNHVEELNVGSGEIELEKLKKALDDRWDSYLTSVSSGVSTSLSIEHLGMIFNRLAEEDTLTVNRTFLPGFKIGEPNLITCHQSETYSTVLSVYSHEDNTPLPQSDEILLCTPHTTLEMVQIFWRRAFYADNNKIYCLVNADLLDYDVSDKSEKSLARHINCANRKGPKYKLVVICSSENEYKSRIAAALDKYHRLQLSPVIPNIRKYLLTKLKAQKATAASVVDFDSVRVVKSWRAGLGKSLYKKRMVANLDNIVHSITRSRTSHVTIPLHEKRINIDDIMDVLLQETLPPNCQEPRIFHIDISHEVREGVDVLLFQLLILGCLAHSSGNVWRKSEIDYYIIESMPILVRETDTQGARLRYLHNCLDLLPHITCRSPQECLDILTGISEPSGYTDYDLLFDTIEFKSTKFQRPYQYLMRLDTNCSLDNVNSNSVEGDEKQCLNTLLRHCGIKDPSWSELHNFVSFLNKQLQDFEVSAFCGLAAVEDLPGFAKFVLRFLIQMSRDFSTRSLIVSEESSIQTLQQQMLDEDTDEKEDNLISMYQMRRGWETSPHPYLFFNPDHHSLTFLGFNIQKTTGNLIDQQTKKVLDRGIIQQNLFDALVRNSVNLAEHFDNLPRIEKIKKLCQVMGLDIVHDPDESYELTADNVKKILAIYMRFRCDIPVIIMGETGCGKTRLIKFMCCLQQPPGVTVENMILMKMHGGIKVNDIVRKVRKAEEVAKQNAIDYPHMDTVLFFDEANATEAIGVIKQIMCDKSLDGKPIQLHERLKIVAACNPYRKHSEELIKRLEQAGLGYHVDADKTTDKLGHVPMRRLVYRVQPLPQSMLPLVWDFGQLNTDVEEMYIKQMVKRYINSEKLLAVEGLHTAISRVLRVSQDFMRDQKNECSFVSLRDVERVLQVMSWFHRQSENNEVLFQIMRKDSVTTSEMEVEIRQQEMDDVTRSLVLALGVCYHACLKKRKEYRETVAKYFTQPLHLPRGANQIKEEISRCQSIFLDNVELDKNIARNHALKENVFMMVVCIELRIPMFLVGKPGSSKSLAKTIVADAMQGSAARQDLYKNYKQVQMVSFQCSHLSTSDGILGTFRQCAAYQKDKNLDRFVSVVVLDEIGLAEDSPRMPLKTLHPLLEDGCTDNEEPVKYKKVAFIGISNWALDPAKMNRGILVHREIPDVTELIKSAEGICSSSKAVLKLLQPMIPHMANSYRNLFLEASKEMREFFGLRDFYSLMKMLYEFVSVTKKKPTWFELKYSILRNFGGLENVKPVEIFDRELNNFIDKYEKPKETDPDCSSDRLINTILTRKHNTNIEWRYLLLLTENYGALTILQQKKMQRAFFIFGSSFPRDQEYTKVCRNINEIKVHMETGSTVILLNLENLYESLYDVLNQSYVYFGGERYVDLGLGTHRLKCRVHRKFRLIVVAEKQIVYDKFPIPLINRLEKHFLSLKTILTTSQQALAQKLQDWAFNHCEVKTPAHLRQKTARKRIGDAFVGYNDDTCAAIILYVCKDEKCDDKLLVDGQSILLWCATPKAVLQLRKDDIIHAYFHQQHHESLADYLQFTIHQQKNLHAQITTSSKLMSGGDIETVCRFTNINSQNVTLLSLQSFDTEQQFSRKIKSCFEQNTESDMLLIVQCDCGDQNAGLIACSRYTVQRELQQVQGKRTKAIHVVFLIQLPSVAAECFTGFQCGIWQSAHIDDIHPAPEDIPSVAEMYRKSVSELLNSSNGFKFDNLIQNCIQSALGNIKDQEQDSSRAIDRLKIIFKCLQTEQGEMTFLTGIAKHVSIILKEKEQNSGLVNKNWLSSEASKPENRNIAGTFRKFAVKSLQSKVIPVLAQIIAFIDTNMNLDILTRNRSQDWTVRLWIEILNSPELTQLKYSSIVSSYQQQELREFAVKMTSMEGTSFSATVPFSWLIFAQIEEVLKETILSEYALESHFKVVMKAAEIFQSLPMGKRLSCLEGSQVHEILKSYIVDFVNMVHPIQSEAECKIVCESVMIGCRQLIRGEYGRLLPSMLGCHMVYNLNSVRFKNFSQLVNIQPDGSKKVLNFQQKESKFYLVTDQELTLDILALHVLLTHLMVEPSNGALNKQDTRTKWMRQVFDYRPIVERIFSHFVQDVKFKENQYRERCQKGVENTRSQWTRIVVIKLFIDCVCTSGEEEVDNRQYTPIWLSLKDCNMKDVQSLEKVEKLLKSYCNKKIVSKCFGGDIQKHQEYRSRCNSFFMEIVSQMYFADGNTPSLEVVHKLLAYITGCVGKNKVERFVSKELTIFDDVVDPTPVVRSFLLQQLMQASGPEIENHLTAYFKSAQKLLKSSGNAHHLLDLCVLVLYCMEDNLHQQVANKEDEIIMATKLLRDASAIMPNDIKILEKISYVSKIRFSLTIVAKYLHKQYGGGYKAVKLDAKTRSLLESAAQLCECESSGIWPRRFFVKQMCKCYGIDSYQSVVANSKTTDLQWVCLPELKEKKLKNKCQDRYIVNGDVYKQLRETIVTTALRQNSQTLEQMLLQQENGWQTRIKLLLALHREITMNNLYDIKFQKETDQNRKDFLKEFILNHRIISHKKIAQGIFDNKLWRKTGNVTYGMDLDEQNIVCLLTHYLILIKEIPGTTSLITPLRNIALNPRSMVNSFYPTMPQDELAEIKEYLLKALKQNEKGNHVFYRCPNGHAYVIGECGRAFSVTRCNTCGQEIGGEGHQLRPGNVKDLGEDRSQTGHILGRATELKPVTAPDRKLNTASLAVLRLLTHISMYVGANVNLEAVFETIKPNLDKKEDVTQYLLEHIRQDLTSLQIVLCKNKDDVLVLIHFLLARIMGEHIIDEKNPQSICELLDKASRSKWEENFANRFIKPVLQDKDAILIKWNDGILNDQRLGSNPLLQILYETDQIHEQQNLHEIPAVWRYRAIISVNHLKQMMDSTQIELPVLKLFLDEDHHLQAIRFVPSITRLHKMLIRKYGKKLNREEATSLTIDAVKEQMMQERRLTEFENLLDDYIEAWNCVRENLDKCVFPVNGSIVTVDKKYCRSDITGNTPILQLLPTHRDAGLCSYAMLFFLLKKQNTFLQKYCVQTKQREDSLPKVHLMDASSAHLISYHPDRELLPMVLANCNYSFEVGQGIKVEYNFTNLERQLMDRFLFFKSIIIGLTEIETMTYRSESTSAVVFKTLCAKIRQERLSPAVQSQIYRELHDKAFPDLCESLDKLDLAISFLKSVGSDPDSSLYDFMTNTLKIVNPFPSPKAQHISKCKHVMSLWMNLALKRAKFLANYEKNAFEGLSDKFKMCLTNGQINVIRDIVSNLQIEQIDTLEHLIFECIVLRIDVPQNVDDEDYIDMSNISLRDALVGYIDACPYEDDLQIDDTIMDAIGLLPAEEDPNKVLTRQCVEVWTLVNKVFTQKQKQRN